MLELRNVFGLAREVFIVAYRDEFWQHLPAGREPSRSVWSVPASAGPDDVLLVYRPGSAGYEGAITDVFRVNTPPSRVDPGFRDDPDWMARIERVAQLNEPIPFSRLRELRAHGGIESRPNRTRQWKTLHRELVERGDPSHSLNRLASL